jgi:ribokinase
MVTIRSALRIVVVGSSNTDMTVKAPRLPLPGETILGGEFLMTAGGKGANQAVAAARALDPRSRGEVVFIARVGDDMFGRKALEGFKREGIVSDYILKDPEAPSGVALITVDSRGENAITVAPGANARLSPRDIDAASHLIASASVLLMPLEVPMKTVHRAAEIASAHGVRVIINPAPAQPILGGDLLRHVSILTPNETEAEILTGVRIAQEKDLPAAAAALLAIGLEAVFITLGPRGVYAASADLRELIPAFEVEAVDATAAGDVFSGALAVALAEGMSLTKAALFANAAAALSVTKMGAQLSAPRRAEIDDLLRHSEICLQIRHFKK